MLKILASVSLFVLTLILIPFVSYEQAPALFMAIVASLILVLVAIILAIKRSFEDIGKN